MLKTLIHLPDGRKISSGAQAEAAILSATLTQCVNDSQELMLGSVCANMLEVQILDPYQSLLLEQGDEIQVFKTDEDGIHRPLGWFYLEKPVRSSANILRITAYDRVIHLDKDLSGWLSELDGWPYSLLEFAHMVCAACDLELKNDTLPNGDYPVQAFAARGITGRKLMQWIGQIAGRFCRANVYGELEFAWYTPCGIQLTPGGERYYYQNGLSYENYQVEPIEKVQLQLTQDDVGAVWPDETGEKNTYRITGNFLLTSTDTQSLQPVARNLYEMLKDVSYTPCRIQIPACPDIRAGHSVEITDRSGKTFTAFVMTKIQSGQLDTLECTGSIRRDSTTATNQEDYRTLNSKILELRKEADGLDIRALQTQTAVDGVTESVGHLQLKSDELLLQMTQLENRTDRAVESVNDTVKTLQQEVSAKMTAEAVQLQIRQAMENGSGKVVTNTGFTFDDRGMTVEKSGNEMKTQITEDGMTVYQNNSAILVAGNQGVDARNLRATTYLIVGRSRFEDYGYDRTGCFWIGG